MFKSIHSFLAAAILLAHCANAARADIYQWEYVNPSDPNSGKMLGSTLAPDGAGVDAVPGADLHSRNLTMAFLVNIQGANLQLANLTNALFTHFAQNANFMGANLTGADLEFAFVSNANFTGATVKGAKVSTSGGFTTSQLYSTASYINGDLSGIKFRGNLFGWSFINQNLTGANLGSSTLTGANFTGAIIKGADFTYANDVTLSQLYSTASYVNGDLSGIGLGSLNLTGVNFANQNLTGANLGSATLTGANFTGAIIKGSDFTHAIGFTASQLTSTASYANGDLSGIVLENDNIDLTGVNFANFNLASVNFGSSNLTNANFTNANLVGANIDSFGATPILTNANFTGANLTGATLYSDLSNVNFTNANLTGATVGNSYLTNANFTGAIIKGATIRYGFTPSQLHSTASYAIGDLSGITLNADLSGVNLANQNLTGASLSVDLTNANLAGANLTNATFTESTLTNANFTLANLVGARFYYPYLTNANFTGANLTGATFTESNLTNSNFTNANLAGAFFDVVFDLTDANFAGADLRGAFGWFSDASNVTHNTIRPDGSIQGLALLTGEKLVVRNNSIPITVSNSSMLQPGSELQILINGDAWGSTISFAPGIPVALGGSLELNFASGMSLAGQVGRTFDLFDWTGVSTTGAFTVSSPYTWNLTNLYTTGEVTLLAIPGLPGDFNQDGTVDAADYVVWRKTGGSSDDYNAWRTHFGQTAFRGSSLPSAGSLSAAVPEPTSLSLVVLAAAVWCLQRRRAV